MMTVTAFQEPDGLFTVTGYAKPLTREQLAAVQLLTADRVFWIVITWLDLHKSKTNFLTT